MIVVVPDLFPGPMPLGRLVQIAAANYAHLPPACRQCMARIVVNARMWEPCERRRP